jgi:hypothetical protein
MGNKKGHIKTANVNPDGNKPAIEKLADFCNCHSLSQSDRQLALSFESFFVDNRSALGAAAQIELRAIHELLPTLNELSTQLGAGPGEDQSDEASQTDSSNRLYASLKRHPE